MSVLLRPSVFALVASTLLLAACSSGGGPQSNAAGAASSSTSPPATQQATATIAVETQENGSQESDDEDEPPVPELLVDFGVTESSISIGYSLDLSGPLSAVDAVIFDAHAAFFADVNDRGGIAGRRVELVALDHASDVDAHLDNVSELTETGGNGVLALGSVGSGELLAQAMPLVESENMAAVSRGNVPVEVQQSRRLIELGETTCVDTIFGLSSLLQRSAAEVPTAAIVTRGDSYGVESAEAARRLAAHLEIEVVVDEQTGADDPAIIKELVNGNPDVVWVAVSPRELGFLLASVSGIQTEWQWAGAPQSYDSSLLQTPAAPALAQLYTHVASVAPFDQADADARADRIRRAIPESLYADADSLAFGWQQAELLHSALLEAADSADMRRASIPVPRRSVIADGEASSSRLFMIEPTAATLETALSMTGATGLIEQPAIAPLDAELLTLCS